MSVSDFEGMDFDEFNALCRVFSEHEDEIRHDAWERARIVGTLAVSPYVKGHPKPQKILPLPWDEGAAMKRQRTQRPPLSREEDKKRLEELMKGMKKQ